MSPDDLAQLARRARRDPRSRASADHRWHQNLRASPSRTNIELLYLGVDAWAWKQRDPANPSDSFLSGGLDDVRWMLSEDSNRGVGQLTINRSGQPFPSYAHAGKDVQSCRDAIARFFYFGIPALGDGLEVDTVTRTDDSWRATLLDRSQSRSVRIVGRLTPEGTPIVMTATEYVGQSQDGQDRKLWEATYVLRHAASATGDAVTGRVVVEHAALAVRETFDLIEWEHASSDIVRLEAAVPAVSPSVVVVDWDGSLDPYAQKSAPVVTWRLTAEGDVFEVDACEGAPFGDVSSPRFSGVVARRRVATLMTIVGVTAVFLIVRRRRS
jgi:hypothetical protein